MPNKQTKKEWNLQTNRDESMNHNSFPLPWDQANRVKGLTQTFTEVTPRFSLFESSWLKECLTFILSKSPQDAPNNAHPVSVVGQVSLPLDFTVCTGLIFPARKSSWVQCWPKSCVRHSERRSKRSDLFTLGERREQRSSHFVGNALRPNLDASLLFSVLFQVYGNAGLPSFFRFIRQRKQKLLECDCLLQYTMILTLVLQRDFSKKKPLLKTPKGLMLCNQVFVSVRRKTKTKTMSNPLKAAKTKPLPEDFDVAKALNRLHLPRLSQQTLSPTSLSSTSSCSLLEQKMSDMEMRHREELETLKQEKGSLQALVGSQSGVIRELEAQLSRATGNSTALQRQQQEMMDTVHNLLNLCSKDGGRLTRWGF